MSFNLQQLRIFTTIVSCGSLGRAAATLHLTQPALSRALKRLEESVGAPLFERHTKGMHLTPVGAALLPHALALQRDADQARDEIDALRGLARGTIKVGAVGSIACLVLPQAIGRVLEKWPGLRVEVIEGVWDRLAEGLLTHEIDLALCMAEDETDELCAIPDCRWTDRSHVVAAFDHPLRRKRGLQLVDTVHARWAVPPRGTGPYTRICSAFAAQGLGVPDIAVETRSVIVLKSLIAHCGFLGWMSEPMYDAEQRAGLFGSLDIAALDVPRTLTAFRRRQGILPAPALKLLDELRHLTGSLPGA